MAVAVKAKLTKFIHRKAAEFMAPLQFGNTAIGVFMTGDRNGVMPDLSYLFMVNGASGIYRYSAEEDAMMQLPSSGISGAFGAGSCGEFRAMSFPGAAIITATGGTTTTINTGLTLAKSLKGCAIRIVAGPGAGFEGRIARNTVGSNAVITLESAAPVAITSATQFQIFGGALWFFCGGTSSVGFRVFDIATNTWYSRSFSGLPTAFGTDACLVSTGSAQSVSGAGFSNGTSTGSNTTTTLADTAKAWPVNGWTASQVRIKSGTGAGQVRTIASNTANTLTVSGAWTTTPDATSVYVIEGNDDFMYLMGNGAVPVYRYSVSGDVWVTLSPVAARAGAPGTGMMCHFADNVPDWIEGSAGIYSSHHSNGMLRQNGRYIYSFRGGNTNTLDVYDVAANTWYSGMGYGNQTEAFSTGSSGVDGMGCIFIQNSAGRFFRFDIAANDLEPLFVNVLPQSTAVVGGKTALQMFRASDGNGGQTVLPYIYALSNSRSELIRFLLI